MSNSSPYDLNATAREMIKSKRERTSHSKSKKTNLLRSPDGPSPYDLSSHGGLAHLAEIARKNPLRFR